MPEDMIDPEKAQLAPRKAPVPQAVIGGHEYFTAEQIADALGVPVYNVINKVRQGEFGGQKLGRSYIISGDEFYRWINSGNFGYKSRKPRHE